MNSLNTLMSAKNSKTSATSKIRGASLGQFTSPVNGQKIELIAIFSGNEKIGKDEFIQLSVLPVMDRFTKDQLLELDIIRNQKIVLRSQIKAADPVNDKSLIKSLKSQLKQCRASFDTCADVGTGTEGRRAICGDCPHARLGTCYAYDQGLFSMINAYRKGNYKTMDLDVFLKIAQTKNVRFGRFGDLSLLDFDFVKKIADNSKAFTGYTNQWRSKFYDSRFNDLFMISTLGNKDSDQAFKKYPDARQFKVIHTATDYTDNIKQGMITCPSERDFKCYECMLCDGGSKKVAGVSIEIKAHGLDFKSVKINRLLRGDIKDQIIKTFTL